MFSCLLRTGAADLDLDLERYSRCPSLLRGDGMCNPSIPVLPGAASEPPGPADTPGMPPKGSGLIGSLKRLDGLGSEPASPRSSPSSLWAFWAQPSCDAPDRTSGQRLNQNFKMLWEPDWMIDSWPVSNVPQRRGSKAQHHLLHHGHTYHDFNKQKSSRFDSLIRCSMDLNETQNSVQME